MTFNYSDQMGFSELLEIHHQWGQSLTRPLEVVFKNRMVTDRRIHLGFVSGDFRWHSVAFFLIGLIHHLDRNDFEITCFSDNRSDDEMTGILREFSDGWVDCQNYSDETLWKTIIRSRVDVLVDLSGHTSYNRMGVFGRRAAPLQLSWLGYPTPTGNPQIDFWMIDEKVNPFDVGEQDAGFRPVILPGGMHAYQPPLNAIEMPTDRFPPDGETICLGCFNHRAKISESSIRMWAEVMRNFPTARLLLKSRSFADRNVIKELKHAFSRHGVESERIEYLERTTTTREHLECYRSVDIALDTYPYNGTTTTCESLWMGVPVISMRGESPASRVGSSLLSQLGRSDWIAEDPDSYVERVSELIGNEQERKLFRVTSRAQMYQSGLTNTRVFASNWSHVVRELWAKRVNSEI